MSKTICIDTAILESTLMCFGLDMVHIYAQVMNLQLILVNYRNGQLHFSESLKIDLEENLEANYAKIREIMKFVTNECHRLR